MTRTDPQTAAPGPRADSGSGVVLSCDPGGTTGLVVATRDDPLHPILTYQLGPHLHHFDLYAMLSTYSPDTLVCERFDFRKATRDKVELISREYIGVLTLYAQSTNTPLHMQTASIAKRFVTDSKLRALDMYQPGLPHSNDATRHLIYHLVVKEQMRSPITTHWKAEQ